MAGKLYRGTGGSCPFIMYPITSGKEGGTGNPCRPSEKLNTDTNTPITLSCRDKDLCLLADTLNQSLEQLRAMQHCFKQGNTQLQTSITSISHDLRTPLTTICGYLELLEKEPLSAVSRQYVAIIRECTKVMTQLTEELFRYSVVLSVPLAQPLQEVSVNRILEGSIAAMYVVLKRHRITPDITITDHTVLRTLDPSALSRVFSNLLNNAVKTVTGIFPSRFPKTASSPFPIQRQHSVKWKSAGFLTASIPWKMPKMRPVLGFHCTDTGGADARADGCLL